MKHASCVVPVRQLSAHMPLLLVAAVLAALLVAPRLAEAARRTPTSPPTQTPTSTPTPTDTSCNAGTAAVGDVLSGKTFSSCAGLGLTGTMLNNGAVMLTPSTTNQTIAAGYHNGAGYCAGDTNLVTGNIKGGVTIFGIAGRSTVVDTGGATATAPDMVTGKTAYVSGSVVTGTMPNNGTVVLTPTTTDQAIAAGYHNGAGYCAGDSDLVSGNIKSGVDLFGVTGSSTVVDTSGATATAADMASGTTAYVNGSLVTGTVPPGANVNGTNGLKTFNIPDALYSGSKTATATDSNLVAGNITNGVNIFGVTGTALPAQRLKTGQTSSYGTGSDGDLQKGLDRSFTDNGDGTITDNKTGLMWEKKSDDGSIHDKDNTYTWGMTSSPYTMNGTLVTTFLATLNGGGGFAGHTDWRIPNVNELESLPNYQNFDPSVDPAFNTGCVAGCTVASCSCTRSDVYWSSTTFQQSPGYAFIVEFFGGRGNAYIKSSTTYVRAVRGGL